MAVFKVSLLITALSARNYSKSKIDKENENDEVYDNLFNNLTKKNMVHCHAIFWAKRIVLVILVTISPYFENYYSIIGGFIFSLVFISLELDFQISTSKIEFIYVVLFNLPVIFISFMAMLMEGHYVSYFNKYLSSQVMMFLILVVYILIVPFRFYDYYKYRVKQEEKKAALYAQRIPNTSNITSSIGLKEKDLSMSDYNDQPGRTSEVVPPMRSPQQIGTFKFSSQVSSGFDESHFSGSHSGWKKNKLSGAQSEASNNQSINSIYQKAKSNPMKQFNLEKTDEVRKESEISEVEEEEEEEKKVDEISSLSESSREEEPPNFAGAGLNTPMKDQKKFSLPQF